MKMIKLCVKPKIIKETDRWNCDMGTWDCPFHVYYLPNDLEYKKLRMWADFELSKEKDSDIEERKANIEKWTNQVAKVFKDTGFCNLIHQYNAYNIPNPCFDKTDNMIRMVVTFYDKNSLLEWKWYHPIQAFVLRQICKMYNRYSVKYGENKKYWEWVNKGYKEVKSNKESK
ncbi:MAG: hypothetical protein PHF86_09585 [Candidatus Nanoarchaeia archaeon]|jgi:hypothetical protein|nr:hypothetical protein [Candidatus Nanoarchaeia archaeon]